MPSLTAKVKAALLGRRRPRPATPGHLWRQYSDRCKPQRSAKVLTCWLGFHFHKFSGKLVVGEHFPVCHAERRVAAKFVPPNNFTEATAANVSDALQFRATHYVVQAEWGAGRDHRMHVDNETVHGSALGEVRLLLTRNASPTSEKQAFDIVLGTCHALQSPRKNCTRHPHARGLCRSPISGSSQWDLIHLSDPRYDTMKQIVGFGQDNRRHNERTEVLALLKRLAHKGMVASVVAGSANQPSGE